METYFNKAVKKYFDTISKVGTISDSDKRSIFVVLAAYDIYRTFWSVESPEDIEYFEKFIRCHAKDTCLFDRRYNPDLPYYDHGDSLITIEDGDMITTTTGTVMASTQRVTRKFTDFEVRQDMQADNYLVGFDASDNMEISVKVDDIGIFWE